MNRGPEAVHPSPFALEQLLAGQASPEVTSHLLVCEACRAQLSEMERTAKTFSASPRSLRAKDAATRADQRWKQRAAMLTLLPVAMLALIGLSTIKLPVPDQVAVVVKPVVPSAPKLRQGREVLDPRQEPWRVSLRSVPLRGHNVEFGQGSLEASINDGPARPFTLRHTKVDIDVTGFMQAVTVTQTFANPFSSPVEALYVFPLPDDSAVHDMTMTAGNRVIRANIQKRAVARQQYEQAKAEGRRAALLDQERPNIFTQSLANLLPGETVTITLQYVAPLRYDDGIYTLNFPMVVGPRYLPGAVLPGQSQGSGVSPDTDVVPDGSRISPPGARSGRDIEVAVRLNAGTVIEDLWSVSHRLELDRPSSSQINLGLNPMDTLPNKDLIVRWRVSGTQARAAVLAAGGAFALMLNPESKDMNTPPTPKEMVFVIDTSCSMNGAPLNAAKRAMTQALQQMNAEDTFMLIDFADTASSFHDGPLPATPNDVRRALGYLQALPSGGGTNQLAGIRRALARKEDPKRLRMVLLMTDGFIGNEEEILAETRKLRGNARIFGFGIGSSVNHFLLSRLSDEGRGFYQYLRPDEDAVEAVNRFTRRVARPLITDISIDYGGLEVSDATPAQVPDLFDVQPLIINARYRKPGSGTVVLRGMRAGFPVVFEVPVTLPELSTNGRALQMAWARRRIEKLSAVQYNIEQPEVVEQITSLGLEFHLVTKYTSLVAVEDVVATNVVATTVTEPTLTPDQTEPSTGDTTIVLGNRGYKSTPQTVTVDGNRPNVNVNLMIQAKPTGGTISGKGKGDEHGNAGLLKVIDGSVITGEVNGMGGLGLRGTGVGGGGLGYANGAGRGHVGKIEPGRFTINPAPNNDPSAFQTDLGGDTGTTTTKALRTTRGEAPKADPVEPKGGFDSTFGYDRLTTGTPVAKKDPPVVSPPLPVADPVPVAVTTPTPRPPPIAPPTNSYFVPVAVTPTPNPVEPKEPLRTTTDSEDGEDFASAYGAPKKATESKPRPKVAGYLPPAPGAGGEIKDELGTSDILEVVGFYKPQLLACVEQQRRLDPGHSGKLLMKWIILTNGTTSNVSVASEEFRETPIARCVGALIKMMKFPRHKKLGDPIVFPFKF